MVEINYILFILVSISLGELAIQVVNSDLSNWIKGQLLLNQPYHSKLQSLSLSHFWRRLLGNWWFIAIPFIFLIKIHKFFSEMLACPYCCGTHLAWITYWLYLDLDIITALLLAPVTLVAVAILDRLHTK